MKKQLLFVCLVGMCLLSCDKKAAEPEFEMVDKPFTGSMKFATKSQSAAIAGAVKVFIEGTGSFSFAENLTMRDEFIFNLATGAGTHKVTWTAPNGDTINADMFTAVGASKITGTTIFSGGTGRFAKIKGQSANSGPLLNADGTGTWDESGQVTF